MQKLELLQELFKFVQATILDKLSIYPKYHSKFENGFNDRKYYPEITSKNLSLGECISAYNNLEQDFKTLITKLNTDPVANSSLLKTINSIYSTLIQPLCDMTPAFQNDNLTNEQARELAKVLKERLVQVFVMEYKQYLTNARKKMSINDLVMVSKIEKDLTCEENNIEGQFNKLTAILNEGHSDLMQSHAGFLNRFKAIFNAVFDSFKALIYVDSNQSRAPGMAALHAERAKMHANGEKLDPSPRPVPR